MSFVHKEGALRAQYAPAFLQLLHVNGAWLGLPAGGHGSPHRGCADRDIVEPLQTGGFG